MNITPQEPPFVSHPHPHSTEPSGIPTLPSTKSLHPESLPWKSLQLLDQIKTWVSSWAHLPCSPCSWRLLLFSPSTITISTWPCLLLVPCHLEKTLHPLCSCWYDVRVISDSSSSYCMPPLNALTFFILPPKYFLIHAVHIFSAIGLVQVTIIPFLDFSMCLLNWASCSEKGFMDLCFVSNSAVAILKF